MNNPILDSQLFASKLEEILNTVPWLRDRSSVRFASANQPDPGYDFILKLPLVQSRNLALVVECKNQPRPSQFAHVARTHRTFNDGSQLTTAHILAAPHISPRIAELCKKHGWGWFDLAGNCNLSFPDLLHIEKSGLKSDISIPRPKANLSTDASARVLRTLLSSQFKNHAWTQTELQKSCAPSASIGLVNKVTHYLRDQAWLKTNSEGKFVLNDPLGLLKFWAKKYKFKRHTRVNYFSLLKPDDLRYHLKLLSNCELNNTEKKAAYAAFSAADYHAPTVKQNKTWLYVNKAALEDFIELTSAKQVDQGENIVVLIPSDDGVFYDRPFPQKLGLPPTSPIQTWLDLQHTGSRGEEAAEAIMQQCIMPALENQPYGQ